jgi:hypothetical protein
MSRSSGFDDVVVGAALAQNALLVAAHRVGGGEQHGNAAPCCARP